MVGVINPKIESIYLQCCFVMKFITAHKFSLGIKFFYRRKRGSDRMENGKWWNYEQNKGGEIHFYFLVFHSMHFLPLFTTSIFFFFLLILHSNKQHTHSHKIRDINILPNIFRFFIESNASHIHKTKIKIKKKKEIHTHTHIPILWTEFCYRLINAANEKFYILLNVKWISQHLWPFFIIYFRVYKQEMKRQKLVKTSSRKVFRCSLSLCAYRYSLLGWLQWFFFLFIYSAPLVCWLVGRLFANSLRFEFFFFILFVGSRFYFFFFSSFFYFFFSFSCLKSSAFKY